MNNTVEIIFLQRFSLHIEGHRIWLRFRSIGKECAFAKEVISFFCPRCWYVIVRVGLVVLCFTCFNWRFFIYIFIYEWSQTLNFTHWHGTPVKLFLNKVDIQLKLNFLLHFFVPIHMIYPLQTTPIWGRTFKTYIHLSTPMPTSCTLSTVTSLQHS